ncbi:MAG: SDR family NAD(P)-dependent oxidoreductase [Acidobacteriota bacterium]
MTQALPLSGRSAVITGGGRGIGAEAARQLAEAGASVVVTARSQDQIDAVAEALRADGHTAHAFACDVGDPAQILALRDAAIGALGTIDIVVNNAGIASSATVGRTTLEEWERIMRINSTGVFLMTQAFLQPMLEQGWGRVVNVSSVAGKAGAPYISAYCASKHAVIGFTRAAAVEVAERGVTVNAVCPGYVETDMAATSIETIVGKTGIGEDKARQALERMSPQKRIFGCDEVAAQILYLCLPLAAGVNGQSLVLDGGAFQA